MTLTQENKERIAKLTACDPLIDQCYLCDGPVYVDPPRGNRNVMAACLNQECGHTRLCKDNRSN